MSTTTPDSRAAINICERVRACSGHGEVIIQREPGPDPDFPLLGWMLNRSIRGKGFEWSLTGKSKDPLISDIENYTPSFPCHESPLPNE